MNATRILVAVDGTDATDSAPQRAVQLFGEDADITIISVASTAMPPVSALGITSALYTVAQYTDLRSQSPKEAATDRVEAAATSIEDAENKVETLVDFGDAGDAICDVAAERNIDVIVIGTHDLSWWERFMDGSNTDYIVRNAPCDVLVVRPHNR